MSTTMRYQYDERIKNLEEERKEENSRPDAVVEKAIASLQKQAPKLAIPTMVTKMYTKSHIGNIDNAGKGLSADQIKQLDEINAIDKISNKLSLEGSPYAKYLGEIAGALGMVQQVATAKSRAKESTAISDNITKAVYHLQNGGKFNDIKNALGAGTLKSMMGAAGTISAGSWLHDMATTGQISNLTSGALTASNPGMMVAGMAGGIGGLGQLTGSVGSGILGGLGSLTGSSTLGKGASMLSTLDPATATILGTLTMVGASMGVSKIMNKMIKDSPLANTKRQNRWNMSHSSLKSAGDNPMAMANYVQSNNILKQMANQNILSPGETQMLSKLNEIAFYTSTLHDIYDSVANTGHHARNNSTRALNKIDKDQINRDMDGKELQNLFKGGKISPAMLSFLRHNEGLKYLSDIFNPGMYLRSLSGKDTAPGQFKTREALQQGDPLGAKKEMASKFGITIADVDLLHADLKERIANADSSWEGRLLASGIYSGLLLQLIATKMVEQSKAGGGKGLVGSLAKLQEEQDKRYQENQNMFIDGTIKPIMKWMSTVPGLSALVPALHATNYVLGTGAKAVSGLSTFIANPLKGSKKLISGIQGLYDDMRDNIIDSMKPDDIKNEKTIRNAIGANALSLQDRAYMYIANELPKDMQKLQWLLGSTENAKVQDRYTGEFVSVRELKKRYQKMSQKIDEMTGETNPEETYLDELKNWGLKKLFRIDKEAIKNSSYKNYDHINSMLDELDIKGIKSNKRTNNLRFRSNPENIGADGTPLGNTLNFISNQFKNFSKTSFGPEREEDKKNELMKQGPGTEYQKLKMVNSGLEYSYYGMMSKYIPMLEDIRGLLGGPKSKQNNKMSGSTLIEGRKLLEFKQNNSINPINLYNKNLRQSMQENVSKSRNEDLMERFFEVYFKQLPYLEKIHKYITKKDGPKSGYIEAPKDGPNPLGNLISGIGGFLYDAVMDLFGFGDGKTKGKIVGAGKKLFKFGVSGAGGIASGLMRLAGVLAKPGPLAIGSMLAMVAGAGIDFFFNDGKIMKNAWNSLKESSFGQGVADMWDKVTKFVEAGYDFFANFVANLKKAFLGKWEDTKETVTNAWNNTFGISTIPKDQIIKDMDSKKTAIEKIQYLNSLGNKISGSDKQELIEKIHENSGKEFEKKWGFSMESPHGANEFVNKKFGNLNAERQAQFAEDYNTQLNQLKLTNKMGSAIESQYQKINDQISNTFKKQFEDTRSDTQKQEESKLLQETLEKIKEVSLMNTEAMNKIVTQTTNISLQTSKSLSDQIMNISNSQSGISNLLNITAKTIQKPNIIELDKNVISILPILKG